MADLHTSYQTLGIAPGATLDQAITAWQVLAGPLQPDRLVGIDPELRAEAEAHLTTLNEAWFVVHNHITTGEVPTALPAPPPTQAPFPAPAVPTEAPPTQAPPTQAPPPPPPGSDASQPPDLERSYRLLGVAPGATQEQLNNAWQLIAGPLQPDRMMGAGAAMRVRAEMELAEMTEAWDVVQAHMAATTSSSPLAPPTGSAPNPIAWPAPLGTEANNPFAPPSSPDSRSSWEAPTASSPFGAGPNQSWGGPTSSETPGWGAAPGFAQNAPPPGEGDPGLAWINAPGHQRPSSSSQSRSVIYSVAFAVISGCLILGLILYRRNETQHNYPQSVQNQFMSGCTGGAATPTQCRCLLDNLMADVSYDRFMEMDREMTSSSAIPPEFRAAAAKCI